MRHGISTDSNAPGVEPFELWPPRPYYAAGEALNLEDIPIKIEMIQAFVRGTAPGRP